MRWGLAACLQVRGVLEGLNALLDHRAEVYIPELAQAFACPPSFRVFAAQNPVQEGGGRRGLPKSFLNRFTRVHVELLRSEDLQFISGVGLLHARLFHCRTADFCHAHPFEHLEERHLLGCIGRVTQVQRSSLSARSLKREAQLHIMSC